MKRFPTHFLSVVSVLAFALAGPALAEKKKVVFLADGGKNSKTHNHVQGNAVLAAALEASGLGFETSQFKGWPKEADAFEGADCIVIFCNGGGGHLVMKNLEQFEKLIDSGVGLVCLHYGVEVPKGKAGEIMLSRGWGDISKRIGRSTRTGWQPSRSCLSTRSPGDVLPSFRMMSGIITCASHQR